MLKLPAGRGVWMNLGVRLPVPKMADTSGFLRPLLGVTGQKGTANIIIVIKIIINNNNNKDDDNDNSNNNNRGWPFKSIPVTVTVLTALLKEGPRSVAQDRASTWGVGMNWGVILS